VIALTSGSRLGVYEIVTLLGAGGMGEVYRARDTKLGRDVAIKVLPSSVAADPERLARFEREARLLASLNHPNIGAIYGVEESGSLTALVLELVEGESLAERLARAGIRDVGLGIRDSLAIARQIADALDAAHERGIVHRDLKPANIAITPDGTVKVLDFGLAKASGPGGSGRSGDGSGGEELTNSPTMIAPTLDGVLLGTAPYMSPEQARGRAVDKRTDIWAFGCVLYEMLTGRRAFSGETISDTIASILEHTPDWSALPSTTPSNVRRLLARCLEKDRKRRFRDIGDAGLEIDDARAQPPLVRPATSGVRRGRSYTTWSAAAIAVVVAFALERLPSPRSTTDQPPSFSRVVRLTSGPHQEKGPAISPDGKWIAYLSNARGPMDVWVKFLAGGEPANLTASSGLEITTGTGITGLEIAPDGGRIAVMARPIGARGQFETWEVPAPLPGIVRKLLDQREFGVHWSADGLLMTFIRAGGSAGDALWIADADGTNRKELIAARGGLHIHWPTWSRDGRIYFIHTFATIINLDQSEIYRIDPRGGPMEPVVSTSRRASFPMPMPDGSGLIYAANPTAAELSLWWRPANGGEPKRLTMGVGEYAESRVSADARTIVATLYELRQSLNRIPVAAGSPAQMTRLTDGYGGDLDPTVSPAADQLVFTSSRSGNRNLWTARSDGDHARPLTTGSALDEQPSFSPDGRQIAFISDRGGHRAIWVINADGGTPRKIVEAAALGGTSWSADGTEVLYAASADSWPSLAKVSIRTGQVTSLATPGAVAAVQPARCPTRDVIAYLAPPTPTGEDQMTTVRFIDSTGRSLYTTLPPPPTGTGFNNGTLAWAPDGRRLAIISADTASPTSVWIVDPDAARPYRQLIELPPGPRIRGITWTRDGSAVIVGTHETSSHIVMLDRVE